MNDSNDSVELDVYDHDPDGVVTHGTAEETTIYPGPPPAGQPRYVWREAEAARTPNRFRDRVLFQFRSPQNVQYLKLLFSQQAPTGKLRTFAVETCEDAIQDFDRASDILMSDELARRGFARRSGDFWGELRRLNREFFDDRMRFLVQNAHMIDPQPVHDGVGDDDEDYAMRMFISDSLRPPGLEYLNGPGPLWAIREDQSTWQPGRITSTGRVARLPGGRAAVPCAGNALPALSAAPRREGFSGAPRPPTRREGSSGRAPQFASGDWELKIASHYPQDDIHQLKLGQDDAKRPRIGDKSQNGEKEDDPWDKGNPNRTPSEAMAEYWGDNHLETDTQTGSKTQAGRAYGSLFAWGDDWEDNGGTRFMRYESVPFWQKGGHEGYDYDIEENLGTAMRETDNHVRKWDLSRLRYPQGQQYRTYGPRSGPIV